MNIYSAVNRGPVPVDMKGFDDLIRRVKAAISRMPLATVIYVKEKGFKVVTKISPNMQDQIDTNSAITVGFYRKGVPTEDLVEDFVFMTDKIAEGL